jgi:hypothetical protein
MGIFYDRQGRALRVVIEASEPEWVLVTHDCTASPHLCRRIMGEWLSPEELASIDWSVLPGAHRAA